MSLGLDKIYLDLIFLDPDDLSRWFKFVGKKYLDLEKPWSFYPIGDCNSEFRIQNIWILNDQLVNPVQIYSIWNLNCESIFFIMHWECTTYSVHSCNRNMIGKQWISRTEMDRMDENGCLEWTKKDRPL